MHSLARLIRTPAWRFRESSNWSFDYKTHEILKKENKRLAGVRSFGINVWQAYVVRSENVWQVYGLYDFKRVVNQFPGPSDRNRGHAREAFPREGRKEQFVCSPPLLWNTATWLPAQVAKQRRRTNTANMR